jgi:hypothetical protein
MRIAMMGSGGIGGYLAWTSQLGKATARDKRELDFLSVGLDSRVRSD